MLSRRESSQSMPRWLSAPGVPGSPAPRGELVAASPHCDWLTTTTDLDETPCIVHETPVRASAAPELGTLEPQPARVRRCDPAPAETATPSLAPLELPC